MEKSYYNSSSNNNNTCDNSISSSSSGSGDNDEYLRLKREKIESLFLYQNFQSVVVELVDLLLKLYGPSNSRLLDSSTYESLVINQETGSVSLSPKLLDICSNSLHDCRKSGQSQCQCLWMVELLIQSLYELGKPSDALKLVNRFYLDGISNTPIDILILSINLLVYLKSYNESKVIIMEALKRNRNEFERDQYEQLVELLVFHVMFRMNQVQESIELLQNDQYLVEWKKEGFIKALYEMVQIREIEEKNQREQLLKKEKEQKEKQKQLEDEKLKQLQQQSQQLQQQSQLNNSNNTSSSSSSDSITFNNSSHKSIIQNFKEFFLENLNEILLIKDLKSLKLAINRIIFGNARRMIYYIFNQVKIIYLKTKLLYLKKKPILKQVLPPIIFLTLVFTIKYLLKNNSNNSNNNKSLINTKKLQISQQQQQQLINNSNNSNNNRRTFGIKTTTNNNSSNIVNRQQPYRNSIHYQQNRPNHLNSNFTNSSNNSNNNNNISTASWAGFKQLISNTFAFNRV